MGSPNLMGIQSLMSAYLPFESCDQYYSSKGLCSFDFFGNNGFSSLFGSTNVPLSRRQRLFNRAVHSGMLNVFLGKQSERADQQAQVLDSILEDASDNDTNSGSGILFEDKICVKRWHCPWGSTMVDYIAPVFRLILEENYLSSSMQPLEDTKKNRSLRWMQRKSLDQRLGKILRDLEDSWFGPIVQFLLLGEWSGCEQQESQKKLMHNLKVKCKVDAHESLIKVITGGAKHICEREEIILQLILNKGCFIDGVGYCNQERWGTYADTSDGVESLSKKALKLILEAAREVEEEECLNREPVILVLDFDVQGGKDHASARYIYTRLSPITRFMFPKDDGILLDYLNEDGQSIEPIWYMHVIPLVLVNGSEDVWYFEDRAAILSLHTQSWPKPVTGSVLNWIARRTVGFAGADLQALCTQAAIIALRRNWPLQEILSVAEKKASHGKRPPLPTFAVEERDWLESLAYAPPLSSQRGAGMAANDVVSSPLCSHLIPCLRQSLSRLLVSLYLDERLLLPPHLYKAATLVKSVIVSALDKEKVRSDHWWFRVHDLLQETDVLREIEINLSRGGILIGQASDSNFDDWGEGTNDDSLKYKYPKDQQIGTRPSLLQNIYYASANKLGFRMLISGSPRSGQRYLASCLLHCFVGNMEIQKVDLATISQEGHGDVTQGVTRILSL
ncbi:unnamed protein product [Camellia sinensis]